MNEQLDYFIKVIENKNDLYNLQRKEIIKALLKKIDLVPIFKDNIVLISIDSELKKMDIDSEEFKDFMTTIFLDLMNSKLKVEGNK